MADKTEKKHLIIDAQLLQTSDRKRGMGMYLASMLDELDVSNLTVTWVVNKRLMPLNEYDTKVVKRHGAEVIELDLLHQGDNEEYANSASINRSRLDKALQPILHTDNEVVYFIPALFSSEIHPVFPSGGVANLLLFYDLIPFLYYRHYFPDHEGVPRKDYAQRFREFYRADHFATISQTTTDDLTMYFGVDPSRMTPIFGSAAKRSHLNPSKPKGLGALDDFVLMPSGDDFRKNNIVAAQAFAALNTSTKLVVTSKFSEGSKRTLSELCPNIVFAGSVSDEEFLWLIDNSRLVFFPPEYEGLGMPLLEAVERDTLVACSNIPVFVEISSTAFFYFDPKSTQSITSVLDKALSVDKKRHIAKVKDEYRRVEKMFSWKNTAAALLEAVDRTVPAQPRQKLAIFCPSPSSYSSVGKYALEVHAELSQLFDIDYYAEDGLTVFEPTRPNILEYAAGYYPANSFTPAKAKQYDYVLYNLGNSEFHSDTILNALRLPGNAIVHDTRLNGIFDWLERQGILTSARRQLEAKLDNLFGAKDTSCLVSLITNQRAVFVHSAFAAGAIEAFVSKKPPTITQTIHPIGVPKIQLAKLGDPTISFAGIISEAKGISIVSDVARNKQLQVRVFGFGVLGDSPLLEQLGSNVQVMKDLTDKDFQDLMRQTDILVNYRPDYRGETSRSVLEAMRYGAAVIVKDVGWYSELPDDTVVKVKSETDVLPAIEELVANPTRLHAIGDAAREFLLREYGYKKYAETLAKNMEKQT